MIHAPLPIKARITDAHRCELCRLLDYLQCYRPYLLRTDLLDNGQLYLVEEVARGKREVLPLTREVTRLLIPVIKEERQLTSSATGGTWWGCEIDPPDHPTLLLQVRTVLRNQRLAALLRPHHHGTNHATTPHPAPAAGPSFFS